MAVRKKLGEIAEQRACDFLQAHGLKLILRNYRCIIGEIDLIMRYGDEIVFVEVRSRTHADYGSAIESINKTKQKKIMGTSIHFLQKQNWLNKTNSRFDVIGIQQNHIEWIKDAFTADIL